MKIRDNRLDPLEKQATIKIKTIEQRSKLKPADYGIFDEEELIGFIIPLEPNVGMKNWWKVIDAKTKDKIGLYTYLSEAKAAALEHFRGGK